MARRPSSKVDYRSLADFRYEIRRFLSFSHAAALAAGIEPQQHQALLAIKGRPPGFETTVGVLAERLQIRHHSAAELSRRLEAHGWIRRVRSGADGREVFLLVSPRGERLLEKLSVSHRSELRSAAPRLLESLGAAVGHAGQSRESHGGRSPRPRQSHNR